MTEQAQTTAIAKVETKASKGGRPLKEVDENLIFELAKIHCTAKEIATIVKCHVDTIYARFSDVLHAGHDEGQMSLKRKMHEKAMAGDTQMLIWLSKQRLGYRDRPPEESHHTTINIFTNEIPK